uniref:VCRL1 variant B n=1 Tax=Phallusia mammillata TaxID=59560 RepID=A0A6F9DBY6_9ASCI|nr:vCRL1 variant B [Phallusia mammillata]
MFKFASCCLVWYVCCLLQGTSGQTVSGIQLSSPKQAVGSDFTVTANVSFTPGASVLIILQSQQVAAAVVDSCTCVVRCASTSCPASGNSISWTVVLTNITLGDQFLVFNDVLGQEIARKNLQPSYCPIFNTNGLITQVSTDSCGFGCIGAFTCNTTTHLPKSTNATCLASATWNQTQTCTEIPPQGLDPGIIALIVILCLLAFGGIVVVVVLYKRKLACFADNADKNPPTEGPACTPLNENQPKNPDSSNDNLSSGQV